MLKLRSIAFCFIIFQFDHIPTKASLCNIVPQSFRVGAVDSEPEAFPFVRNNEQQDKNIRSQLLHRKSDAPFGKLTTSLPLIGGIIVKPLPDLPDVSLKRFDRVLRQAAATSQSDLNILILGGSMSSGRMGDLVNKSMSNCFTNLPPFAYEPGSNSIKVWECYDKNLALDHQNTEGYDCKPCAFGARFESWLKSSYPHKKVNVINLSRGGMGTSACDGVLGGMLQNIGHTIDVVLINFVHNDGGALWNRKKKRSQELDLHKAEYIGQEEEFKRLHNQIIKDAEIDLRKDHEILMRTLLSLPRQPAVLEIELVKGRDQTSNGLYPHHADVIQYYQVPAISWELSASHLKGLTAMGHPSWNVHQLIADWLASTWQRLADHACNRSFDQLDPNIDALPPAKWVDDESSGFCSSLLTYWDAKTTSYPPQDQSGGIIAKLPVAVNAEGNWVFSEDAPHNGKRGWWLDSVEGGKITFPINITAGALNIGGFGYLSSWDPAMGAVRVSIVGDPAGRFAIVNGSNGGSLVKGSVTHTSITNYAPLCFSSGEKEASLKSLLPPCVSSHPRKSNPISRQPLTATTGPISTQLLQFELLPRQDSQQTRNKFVVRYISTC